MLFKNKLIFNKYKVKRFMELSEYCWAYQGVNVKNNEPVFLKFEKRNSRFNFLENEVFCLYNLKGFGLPKILSYGKIGLYNVLIEELLGNSLHNLWNLWKLKKKDKNLNLKNICMVALQVINRLEYIHSKDYIHKDIKPQNFVIGRKDPHIIYIIDFGISKKYRSSRTGKHIKFINNKVTIGSMNFLSINANIGYEQSRRDDLESLGYMLIFLANDNLPWMGFEDSNINKRMKCLKIYNLKKAISAEKLCKGLPEEFTEYINYTRKLKFEEDPNYDYIRKLFLSILFKNHEKNDLNFFWILNKKKIKKEDAYSESLSITFKRSGRSLNSLYNQIKNSLEKKRSQKKKVGNYSLQLEHINNLIFKYPNRSIKYSDDKKEKKDENTQVNNKICNTIYESNDKYICNFNINISNNIENLIDKKRISKNKSINDNKNKKNEIHIYNLYNKNILYDKSNYKKMKTPQFIDSQIFFSNTNCSNNNLKLNYEENNLVNIQVSSANNKDYYFNDSNNPNNTLQKNNFYKNNFVKIKNEYNSLYKKEKGKEKINYDKKKDNYSSPILDKFNSINQNKNNKINNAYNNLSHQEKYKNIYFKEFQINKSKIFKTYNAYRGHPNEIENNLTLEISESHKNLKAYNYLNSNPNESLSPLLKKKKKPNKKNIIYNSSCKTKNNIFPTTNSSIHSKDLSLLNSNIINNDNKRCLTQSNEQKTFSKFFEKEYNKLFKNITYKQKFKNI